MTAADPCSQMLSEMSQCAYRLALTFGGEAERAETHGRRLEFFQLFDRCFFAVRVATALQLRLRRAPAALPVAEHADRDVERAETERPESERAERYDERDREREVEREVEAPSLPVFLRALDGIVADASALPGPQPAALPTLRELLAQVTSKPAPVAAKGGWGAALQARRVGHRAQPRTPGAAEVRGRLPSVYGPAAALIRRRARPLSSSFRPATPACSRLARSRAAP